MPLPADARFVCRWPVGRERHATGDRPVDVQGLFAHRVEPEPPSPLRGRDEPPALKAIRTPLEDSRHADRNQAYPRPRPIRGLWLSDIVSSMGHQPRARPPATARPAKVPRAGGGLNRPVRVMRHCGVLVRAQGPSRAGWVGHPALRAAASAPMNLWGGSAAAKRYLRGEKGERRAFPSALPAAGPFRRRPRPARTPSPSLRRIGLDATRRRPAPRHAPSRVRPRGPGSPVPGRSAAGPRAAPAPGPGSRPASMPVGPRPSSGRLHAARTFNHSYLHRAGNPLYYRVFL